MVVMLWVLSDSIVDAQQEPQKESLPGHRSTSPTRQQDPWHFTLQEIESAYKFQTRFGQRLPNAIRSLPCNLGKREVVSSYQGTEITVPCGFIRQISKQLRELIETGSAKYLFALDVDRANLAVPSDLWETKYRKLPSDSVLSDLLREPSLIALYHSGAYLSVADPVTGQVNREAKAWQDKSNVIGYFNGRAPTILPPDPSGLAPADPDGFRTVATIYFQAFWLGESLFTVNGRPVSFDFSFNPGFFEPGLFDATVARVGR